MKAVEEGESEADEADAASLRDGGVPIPGQGTDLGESRQGEPTEADGQGHKEPVQAVRGADLDEV